MISEAFSTHREKADPVTIRNAQDFGKINTNPGASETPYAFPKQYAVSKREMAVSGMQVFHLCGKRNCIAEEHRELFLHLLLFF